MAAATVTPISSITLDDLERIVPGYSSPAKFAVITRSDEIGTHFSMTLKNLDRPFEKTHHYDPATLESYNEVVALGQSYGAFFESKLVGFIIAEPQEWNSTLIIREFGVSPELRRQGIGKTLLEKALAQAQQLGLRGVLCETQSTNVPAITLYQRLGFSIQGLDLALYSNHDLEHGEVAIFLRKPIV